MVCVCVLCTTVYIYPRSELHECGGVRVWPGLCGAIARNEHEQVNTHTQPTVEQMPAIAAMRVGLYLRLLLFILDSLHDLVFFFFFFGAFGREIASRSHNSKHPPGPKDDGQSSKNSWCRWLLAIPFHLNFRLLLLFFSLSPIQL